MTSIQKLFTSYQPDIDGNIYVGRRGRIWYNESAQRFYVSDGVTPGGIAIITTTASGVPLYIQDTPPVGTGPYQWIQTNYNGMSGNFTIWFNDGL